MSRNCEWCGQPIVGPGKHKNKKFCSIECRANSDRGKFRVPDGELKGSGYRKMRAEGGGTRIRIHRIIANAKRDQIVHHVNGIRSDNRPDNLMLVTRRQHCQIHNQKHPMAKACVVCGKEFTPHPTKRARAQTCGRPCLSQLLSALQKGRPKPRRSRTSSTGGS